MDIDSRAEMRRLQSSVSSASIVNDRHLGEYGNEYLPGEEGARWQLRFLGGPTKSLSDRGDIYVIYSIPDSLDTFSFPLEKGQQAERQFRSCSWRNRN